MSDPNRLTSEACLRIWDAQKNHGWKDGFAHECVRFRHHRGQCQCSCGVRNQERRPSQSSAEFARDEWGLEYRGADSE